MDANWWNNALQSYDVGREHRADRENAQAYQDGGFAAVADTAGRRGDLQTAMATRRFQDDERNRGYQAMEQIAPWARNLVRSTRNRSPEQSRPLLEQNAQRFVDFLTAGGADEETARRQVQAGIAGLTDPNPEVRAQWADSLDQAFQQHQSPDWQVMGRTAVAIQPDGQFQIGGTLPESVQSGQWRPATPQEAQAWGLPAGSVWDVNVQTGERRERHRPNAPRAGQGGGYYDDDGYDYEGG